MATNTGSVLKTFRGKSSITSTEFEKIFEEYDKDGNGYIEAAELDSFLKDLLKEHPEASSYEEFKTWLMSKGDTINKDGKIEKAELGLILPTRENFLLRFREKVSLSVVDFLKIWHSYDNNRSGYLEKDEIENFCQDLLAERENITPEDVKENIESVLTQFDADKDGRLNIQEMAQLLPVNTKSNLLRILLNGRRSLQDNFDNMFAKYDKDGNGEISYSELSDLLADSIKHIDQSAADDKVVMNLLANDFMAAYDTNKDEKLSRAELELYFIDRSAI